MVWAGSTIRRHEHLLDQAYGGIPSDTAQPFANKWLSFSSGSHPYQAISQTLTLSTLLQEVMPTEGISTVAPTVINGQPTIGLRGELPGKFMSTLYISTTGSPLPVESVTTTPAGTTTAMFSEWGEAVNVTAPPAAVSVSSIGLP